MANTDYIRGKMDKHSADFDRPSYLPGKKEPSYYDNYDSINWSKKTKFAVLGKSRKSKTTEMLYIKETVNAARTPVLEREGDTGEKSFPIY